MGIKSFGKILKYKASRACTNRNIYHYKGKHVAIDSSILLYRFMWSSQSPYSHIFGFLEKSIWYLENGILPIYIFDGKPPDEKRFILDQRQNQRKKLESRINDLENIIIQPSPIPFPTIETITQTQEKINKLKRKLTYVSRSHVNDSRNLLTLLGIPYYTPEGEAEKACAQLQCKGVVDYICTEDSDTLTFGAHHILKTTREKNTFQEVNLSILLEELNLSYPEFVDFCILCGCDYCGKIPRIGPSNALRLLQKHKSLEGIFTHSKEDHVSRYLNTNPLYPREVNRAKELFTSPLELPQERFDLGYLKIKDLKDFLECRGIPQHYIDTYIIRIENAINDFHIHSVIHDLIMTFPEN